jgi:hypothetical protein
VASVLLWHTVDLRRNSMKRQAALHTVQWSDQSDKPGLLLLVLTCYAGKVPFPSVRVTPTFLIDFFKQQDEDPPEAASLPSAGSAARHNTGHFTLSSMAQLVLQHRHLVPLTQASMHTLHTALRAYCCSLSTCSPHLAAHVSCRV